MKTKVAFLTFLATAVVSSVWAQSTEDDDMYFTSKDRAALNAAQSASRQEVLASTNSRRITESEVSSTINPTDSYSARNVNPEYISGSKVGGNSTASVQYFSPNYQPTSVNQNLASNSSNCNCSGNSYNGFNNGFGNPYNRFGSFGSPYGMGGMSPYGYNSYGMMNPYSNYGGYGYSPYSMMGMGSGFYGSALSFGVGSGFGNGFGYGSPFGFGNSYGMNSFYGGGFGNGWGYNSFYNPYGYNSGFGYGSRTVVVVERPSRASARNQEVDRYYTADRTTGGNSGGRVATQDYYNRGWRNDVQQANQNSWNTRTNQNSNAWNSGWNNNNTNNGWNNQNSGWGNSGGRSFSSGGGGGGSVGGGGGGGGSRRGRD